MSTQRMMHRICAEHMSDAGIAAKVKLRNISIATQNWFRVPGRHRNAATANTSWSTLIQLRTRHGRGSHAGGGVLAHVCNKAACGAAAQTGICAVRVILVLCLAANVQNGVQRSLSSLFDDMTSAWPGNTMWPLPIGGEVHGR